jgi:hypothetical protein
MMARVDPGSILRLEKDRFFLMKNREALHPQGPNDFFFWVPFELE